MQAIILAAGMGKRLGALTRNNTKCMIQVNGVTLIERMMRQLDRLSPSLEKIVIVTGYEGEKLKTFLSRLDISTPVEYVDNPRTPAPTIFIPCTWPRNTCFRTIRCSLNPT